jgi:lipopolysaccharide export system protein LptA
VITRYSRWLALAPALLLSPLGVSAPARAQQIDLSHGGPVTVTAAGGIDWDQTAHTVTAHDQARAVRGDVTVIADRLIAHYRKKAGTGAAAKPAQPQPAPGTQAAPQGGATATTDDGGGSNEIYRLEAVGGVHIFTATDQAWGDHAVYDIDQAVLVLTGQHLKLTTPQDVLTSRDSMEYWSQKHMAIGRGDATVTTKDGKRVQADVLVGYTDDQASSGKKPADETASAAKPAGKTDGQGAPSSGKLKLVNAFGHVVVRTATEIVTGDRGAYVPDTGIARIVGNVHITRGENQLNGATAIVNMKTGVASLTQAPGGRVEGLIVPGENASPGGQDQNNKSRGGGAPAKR